MPGAGVSFIVRVAEPTEYAEAGFVTADAYRIDDLLRRADGLIDTAYEAELTDAALEQARPSSWWPSMTGKSLAR